MTQKLIHRVNSTGRVPISPSLIRVEIIEGPPPYLYTFRAEPNLDQFNFSPDAEVVIEATCAGATTVLRFPFGRIKNISAEKDLVLDELPIEKLKERKVRFALKVIDTSQKIGRLLGVAKHIKPINASGHSLEHVEGILDFAPCELGEQLWRLKFGDNDDTVCLLFNQTVEGLEDSFKNNPTFHALVFPVIVREVLRRAVYEGGDDGDEDGGWKTNWIKFAKTFAPDKPRTQAGQWDEDSETWIDSVVNRYSEKYRFTQHYTKQPKETS